MEVLICIKPTKTLTKGDMYTGIPVRKSKPNDDYNGRWCTNWEECEAEECTSFKVKDDVDIIRHISKKRFTIHAG